MPLFMPLGILGALGAIGGFIGQAGQTIGSAISTAAGAVLDFGGAVFEGVGGFEGLFNIASGVLPALVNQNEQVQLDALGQPIQSPLGVPQAPVTTGAQFLPGGGGTQGMQRPGGGVLQQTFFQPGGTMIPFGRTFLTPGDPTMGLLGDIGDFISGITGGGPADPLNIFGGNGGTPAIGAGGCPSLFRAGGAATARPLRMINAMNPVTGKIETWEHKGRPVLFASDFRAAKRVRKVASKARRFR